MTSHIQNMFYLYCLCLGSLLEVRLLISRYKTVVDTATVWSLLPTVHLFLLVTHMPRY